MSKVVIAYDWVLTYDVYPEKANPMYAVSFELPDDVYDDWKRHEKENTKWQDYLHQMYMAAKDFQKLNKGD